MSNYTFNYEQYKLRLNKKSNFSFVIVFLLIILLLGLAVFLYPKNYKQYEFYFVEINSFQTYSKATNFATEIKEKGGAGYIYFDSVYRVLACYFFNKEDAESVAKNLKSDYPDSKVYTIKTDKIILPTELNKQQKSCVQNVITTSLNCVSKLSAYSLSLDKQELSLTKLKIYLSYLYNDFDSVCSSFINHFNTNSKYNVAKKYLQKISSNLSTISSFEDEQNLNQNFKNLIIDVVINFYSFTTCFN